MMTTRSLFVIGAITFVVFLTALLPAPVAVRFFLPGTGLVFSTVEGNLSHMVFEQAAWRGKPLGRLDLRPAVLASIFGSPAAEMTFVHTESSGELAMELGHDHLTLSDFSLISDVTTQFGPMLLRGPLSVRGDKLVLNRTGGCVGGEAALRTSILEEAFAVAGIEGPVLSGNAVCEQGVLTVNMSGDSTAAELRLAGTWHLGQPIVLDLAMQLSNGTPLSEDLKIALEFAGLRPSDEGWRGQINLDLF